MKGSPAAIVEMGHACILAWIQIVMYRYDFVRDAQVFSIRIRRSHLLTFLFFGYTRPRAKESISYSLERT
jgi:hypothetical protein